MKVGEIVEKNKFIARKSDKNKVDIMYRFEIMIVLVVFIVFLSSGIKRYFVYKTQALAGNAAAQDLADENTELKTKVDEMEERLKVLETIVTERDFQLDDKIRSMS